MSQGRGIEAEGISFGGLWEELLPGISFPGYALILCLSDPLRKLLKSALLGTILAWNLTWDHSFPFSRSGVFQVEGEKIILTLLPVML